jgi:hypothetical protein
LHLYQNKASRKLEDRDGMTMISNKQIKIKKVLNNMYDVFNLPEVKFPKDFIWGSSTAAYQTGGDNVASQY